MWCPCVEDCSFALDSCREIAFCRLLPRFHASCSLFSTTRQEEKEVQIEHVSKFAMIYNRTGNQAKPQQNWRKHNNNYCWGKEVMKNESAAVLSREDVFKRPSPHHLLGLVFLTRRVITGVGGRLKNAVKTYQEEAHTYNQRHTTLICQQQTKHITMLTCYLRWLRHESRLFQRFLKKDSASLTHGFIVMTGFLF